MELIAGNKLNSGTSRCVALLVLGTLPLSPAPATAHDIYSGLRSNYGTTCCDDSDCRPAQYRVTKAGVQMRVEQKWVVVPPSAIQYRILSGDRGDTAGGHWCGRRAHDVESLNDESADGYFTFCAILPPNFAALPASDMPAVRLTDDPVTIADEALESESGSRRILSSSHPISRSSSKGEQQ
jgi:hypothetical protein